MYMVNGVEPTPQDGDQKFRNFAFRFGKITSSVVFRVQKRGGGESKTTSHGEENGAILLATTGLAQPPLLWLTEVLKKTFGTGV